MASCWLMSNDSTASRAPTNRVSPSSLSNSVVVLLTSGLVNRVRDLPDVPVGCTADENKSSIKSNRFSGDWCIRKLLSLKFTHHIAVIVHAGALAHLKRAYLILMLFASAVLFCCARIFASKSTVSNLYPSYHSYYLNKEQKLPSHLKVIQGKRVCMKWNVTNKMTSKEWVWLFSKLVYSGGEIINDPGKIQDILEWRLPDQARINLFFSTTRGQTYHCEKSK